MANILDYLAWRGDLTLGQSPFNEVDNLILAELSFIGFAGIVPPPGQGAAVPLREAAEAFFRRHSGEKLEMGVLVPEKIPPLLERAAASRRFGAMGVNCAVDCLDEQGEYQFAAVTFELGDGGIYLAFRGTDDTLVGWKEDFNMAFLDSVPGQRMAADYLRQAAEQYKRCPILAGGHSKGGNFAVYAALHCPRRVQNRLARVYNNDGPGFQRSVLGQPAYQAVRDRITTIVPQSSVVGMLLEHEERYTIVCSSQKGVFQHDGFSWEVLGPGFIHLDEITREGQYVNRVIRDFVNGMTREKREAFADALYAVLTCTGARTLTELKSDGWKTATAMARTMKGMDRETRKMLLDTMGFLLKINTEIPKWELYLEDTGEQVRRWLESIGQERPPAAPPAGEEPPQ